MGYIEKDNILRSYVCISDDTNTGLMQVLGIVNSYDEAQLICMKHMFAIVEDLGDDEARVEHSMWKMMEQDTGVILHYSIISDQIVQPNGQNLIILTYDRDMKPVMDKLRNLSETTATPIITATQKDNPIKKFHDICNDTFKSDITSYEGLIEPPPSHPPNEYTEYNYKYLVLRTCGDELTPGLKAEAFKWGFPYMIMTAGATSADPTTVIYGIAAYMTKDEDYVVFITTYNNPKHHSFGTKRVIEISAQDLCSRVKIKCVGMIEGGIL